MAWFAADVATRSGQGEGAVPVGRGGSQFQAADGRFVGHSQCSERHNTTHLELSENDQAISADRPTNCVARQYKLTVD